MSGPIKIALGSQQHGLRLTHLIGPNTGHSYHAGTKLLLNERIDAIATRGIELSYQAANVFVRGLELGSSLTWTDSKITRNDKFPASVGKWQPRIPEWRATAVATYRPDDTWSYTLGARYSGKQYSTLDNSDPNGFAYQGASRYFTTDVRVRYQITKQVSAAVGIDNLNNYQFWNFHPYPQRTYLAELKVSL